MYSLSHLQWHFPKLIWKLEARAGRSFFAETLYVCLMTVENSYLLLFVGIFFAASSETILAVGLQCVIVCYSLLQCVAVRCSALQCVAGRCRALQCAAVRCSALQCVAVCCSVLQCGAVWCSVLQCITERCNELFSASYSETIWDVAHDTVIFNHTCSASSIINVQRIQSYMFSVSTNRGKKMVVGQDSIRFGHRCSVWQTSTYRSVLLFVGIFVASSSKRRCFMALSRKPKLQALNPRPSFPKTTPYTLIEKHHRATSNCHSVFPSCFLAEHFQVDWVLDSQSQPLNPKP